MRNFKVTVDGISYNVSVEEVSAFAAAPAPVPVPVPAAVAAAPVPTVQAHVPAAVAQPQKAAEKSAPEGGTPIVSPMPGMLSSYKVADGAAVKTGQPVLVLEAMKMENDISAPCDGIFYHGKSAGSDVSAGDTLATIK